MADTQTQLPDDLVSAQKRLERHHAHYLAKPWWVNFKLSLLLLISVLVAPSCLLIAYLLISEVGLKVWENADSLNGIGVRGIIWFVILVVIPSLILAAVAFASYFPSKPDMPGMKVTRRDAPQLWAAADNVRKKLSTAKVNEIYITPDANASMLSFPRCGPFWIRRSLSIGLPLLALLDWEELETVIAHELGHTSKDCPRLLRAATYVTAYFQAFASDADDLSEGVGNYALPTLFLSNVMGTIYKPVSELLVPLKRAGELTADDAAGKVYGKAAGDALIKLDVDISLTYESFTEEFYKGTRQHEKPPMLPSRWLVSNYPLELDEIKRQNALKAALSEPTNVWDAHPSLADRLDALGHDRTMPGQTRMNFANTWLGDSLERVIKEFDYRWFNAHGPEWRETHRHLKALVSRRDEIMASKPDADDAAAQALSLELANVVAELDGNDAALDYYRASLALNPDCAESMLRLALHALQGGDDDAVATVENAISLNPFLAFEGYCGLLGHFQAQEDQAKTAHYTDLVRKARKDLVDAQSERSNIGLRDTFCDHSLTEDQRAKVEEFCNTLGNGIRCYLFGKVPAVFPDEPINFLAFDKVPPAMQEAGSINLLDRAARDLAGVPLNLFILLQRSPAVRGKVIELQNAQIGTPSGGSLFF